MAKTGRNAPCPCGSGQKYKKCCLQAEQQLREENEECMRVVPLAMDWLEAHYPEAMSEAITEGFLQGRSTAELEAIEDLPDDVHQALHTNLQEWLLADGVLDLPNGPVPVRQALLDTGGPLLTALQRQWLEAITANRMGLYEVQRAVPGQGLELQDLLLPEPERESLWVQESTASRQLEPGQILGARLAQWQGNWVMTGAGYMFPAEQGTTVMRKLQAVRDEMGLHPDRGAGGEILTDTLIGEWVGFLLDPPPMPDLVDRSTGEPILFTTDHYRIHDRQQLAEALAGLAEVEGDNEQGEWAWLDPKGSRSVWASLSVTGEQRLEVFTRTRDLADSAHQWLVEVAGRSLEWVTREYTDPTSAGATQGEEPPEAAGEVPPELSAEELGEVFQQAIEQAYADWADQPLPVLDDWTPRQAAADPAKREEVIRLLKDYQLGENQQAPEQGRPPADFGFLWDELGLSSSRNG